MKRIQGCIVFGSLLGFLFFCNPAQAQTRSRDSTQAKLPALDTAELTEVFGDQVPMKWGEPYTPLKAGLLSAVLPGLGQVYNGKAWKIALVYGGIAGVSYLAYQNHLGYVIYREAVFAETDSDPRTTNTTLASLDRARTLTDNFRRNRDLAYIGIGLVYLLNIAEANIDAHLSEFNLDDDLQASTGIQMKPLVVAEPGYSGVGIRFVLP